MPKKVTPVLPILIPLLGQALFRSLNYTRPYCIHEVEPQINTTNEVPNNLHAHKNNFQTVPVRYHMRNPQHWPSSPADIVLTMPLPADITDSWIVCVASKVGGYMGYYQKWLSNGPILAVIPPPCGLAGFPNQLICYWSVIIRHLWPHPASRTCHFNNVKLVRSPDQISYPRIMIEIDPKFLQFPRPHW